MGQHLNKIGFVTMTVGFLYGSFLIVQHPDKVVWVPYGIAFAITAVGAVMLRMAQRQVGGDTEKVKTDISTIVRSLTALNEKVKAINEADRDGLKVFGVCKRIDNDCMDHINDFVEAREAMIHRYGLAEYARMMDSFALGERSLNRAWCASADGYIDEVNACLERAESYLKNALEHVERCVDDKTTGYRAGAKGES